MNPLTLSQIAQFAGASLSSGDGTVVINKVSTDSRTIKPGELFVALRGENFEGHDFIEAGAKAGATGALVDLNWAGNVPNNFALLRATDTLQAYQTLAANYRRSLALKVLAITGSNGKTSTKDFAASVLARRFRVTKTEGNFNNHVGLPRTILEATSEDEVAVWEIGMNHPGEIAALSKIAAPDAAIITNIGVAHIEFMGSREAIAAEKGALAEAIETQGTVILNADDPFSEGIAARTRAKVVSAGTTVELCARSKFGRVPTAQSSQSSRARIVAARNFPLRVRTWCRMHYWPSPRGGHLDYPSRNVPLALPRRRSQKRACKSRKSVACNFSTTATTPTRTR